MCVIMCVLVCARARALECVCVCLRGSGIYVHAVIAAY